MGLQYEVQDSLRVYTKSLFDDKKLIKKNKLIFNNKEKFVLHYLKAFDDGKLAMTGDENDNYYGLRGSKIWQQNKFMKWSIVDNDDSKQNNDDYPEMDPKHVQLLLNTY